MTDTRRPWALLGLAAVLLLYFGSYAVLRQRHALVRTGVFLNARLPGGGLAPSARWLHCDVSAPPGSAGGAWLEAAYWPARAIERAFWNSAGCRLRPPP